MLGPLPGAQEGEAMLDWSDDEKMVRDTIRQFVDSEIRPKLPELEQGDSSPFELIRSLFKAFGVDSMARQAGEKAIAQRREGESSPDGDGEAGAGGGLFGTGDSSQDALAMIMITELSRVSPGLVGSMGTSLGLAAATILAKGTADQIERWALELLSFDKVGAWALTEPESGSDAFGGMTTTVRRSGDGYVLNGQKTFITNGPAADTIVVYAKLDDGETPPRDRRILSFVLDAGMEGLGQPAPFAKMGLHSSPTGELFFSDVAVGKDRLLGTSSGTDSGRESVKSSFAFERFGIAAMALGVIEECQSLSVDYAKTRQLWGTPIGDFQLIQAKLAEMEVARLNVQNLVFRVVETLREGRQPSLAEASAMKLYASRAATDVAMEAVQLFGGNGYMAEYRVEQLARDAKSFMIYAGSNEVQTLRIGSDLLGR